MELQGLHILTTRDSLGTDHLKGMLEAKGARVSAIPTLSLLPPDDWSSFDQAAQSLAQFDWAIFTSINAVFQTAKRLKELGLPWNPGLKIAAVGQKTALELESLGWKVSLVPKDFQAEGLLKALEATRLEGKRFFFPRAEQARELLVDGLRFLGAKVELVGVYKNEPAWENHAKLKACLEEDAPHWITFTSASTVQNFLKVLGELPDALPRLASIGKVTSMELRNKGMVATVTAEPQTLEGLVGAIIKKEERDPSL